MSIEIVCVLILFQHLLCTTIAEHNNLLEDPCSEIKCSNVYDYVCGIAKKGKVKIIKKFHNICHFNKARCTLESVVDIYQVPDILCNIKKQTSYIVSRRLHDFSIVGSIQACNHTCPTFCAETYEPVCAKIHKANGRFIMRPMINHCHIDMLSCAAGFNVTITALGTCYKNPQGLTFMSEMAGLKALKLIEDEEPEYRPTKPVKYRYTGR